MRSLSLNSGQSVYSAASLKPNRMLHPGSVASKPNRDDQDDAKTKRIPAQLFGLLWELSSSKLVGGCLSSSHEPSWSVACCNFPVSFLWASHWTSQHTKLATSVDDRRWRKESSHLLLNKYSGLRIDRSCKERESETKPLAAMDLNRMLHESREREIHL